MMGRIVVALLCLWLGVAAPADGFSFERASVSMPWTPMIDTELNVVPKVPNVSNYDLIVVVVPNNTTNTTELSNKTKQINELYDGLIEEVLAKKTKNAVSFAGSNTSVLVLEAGKDDDGTKLGTTLASKLSTEKPSSVLVVLPSSSSLTSSLLSGLYTDKRYKGSEPETKDEIKTIDFVIDSDSDDATQNFQSKMELGVKLAKGIFLTKDIVNAPHNSLNSIGLAGVARKIAAESKGTITCKILDYKECERRGMGAFLGVARGAETHPQFIHLTYKPPKRWGTRRQHPLAKVAIIGKGLLMDTGGYNIKTGMMELMKFDCGGAAAVLGAALALANVQPQGVEAHFVVAACENMINERAIVPGDILTASNGKTIEVINTDAEGRLTMADALVYCDKEIGCERIIELSTLTGACMGALGSSMAGLFTEDESLAEELLDVANSTRDKLWRLPVEKDYAEQIKSKIADLRNLGQGRLAGAITAALFLTNFVEDDKPFAHIDMAGPVWNTKAGGATGWGTKLVTEWVTRQGQDGE